MNTSLNAKGLWSDNAVCDLTFTSKHFNIIYFDMKNR